MRDKTRKPLTLAAIDIGSNGARLLIKRFDDDAPAKERIQKLMFVRIPLRLGKDVFSLGKVSKARFTMMLHMLKGFRQLMKLYGVDYFRSCATSAMRDAENGRRVMRRLRRRTGISLDIIGGEEEARLLFDNLVEKTDSNAGNFAYIDVGGGSTEISLIHDGVLADSRSFNIGTLRMLSSRVAPETRQQLRQHLEQSASRFGKITIIGSGGNINKLCRLIGKKKTVAVSDLEQIHADLKRLSIEERMEKYGLKSDRADVIVPAAEIFLECARCLDCDTILVPNISLADSIVDSLYKENVPTADAD